LLGEPVRKRVHWRLSGKWEDNTKLDLKHRKRRFGMEESGSGYGQSVRKVINLWIP
jgi:hypothetical protein